MSVLAIKVILHMGEWVLQDIFKQATEDRLTSANELPYFEGDFWPNVLEESIKELEQEEEERKKEENTAACEPPEVKLLFLQTSLAVLFHKLDLFKEIVLGYILCLATQLFLIFFSFHIAFVSLFVLFRAHQGTARMPRRRTTRKPIRIRAA